MSDGVRIRSGSCGPAKGFVASDGLLERVYGSVRASVTPFLGWLTRIPCTEFTSGHEWPAWRATPTAAAAARQHHVDVQVIFVGCARNIGGVLREGREHIDALGAHFSNHRLLFWEDSSADETLLVLRQWASRDQRVRLLSGQPPAIAWRRRLTRTARLAFARDVLLREALHAFDARRSSLVPQFLVALDLDCPPPVLSPARLAETVLRMLRPAPWRQQWHVLSANSVPSYYDKWALRSRDLAVQDDCLRDHDAHDARHCFALDIRIARQAPVLAVDSAFNGAAVLAVEALRRSGCTYGTTVDLTACEHVGFNRCLRRHGLRLGIDPSLVVSCGAEHAHPEVRKAARVDLRPDGSLRWRGDACTANATVPVPANATTWPCRRAAMRSRQLRAVKW